MSFNEQLKELRKKNKMTQAELAELIGLKRATVTQYENGRISPSKEVLIKIANLFRVSLDEIVGADKQEVGSNVIGILKTEKPTKKNDYTSSIKSAVSQKIVNELIRTSSSVFCKENKNQLLRLFDLLLELNIKAEAKDYSPIKLLIENEEYDFNKVICEFSKELNRLDKLSELLK